MPNFTDDIRTVSGVSERRAALYGKIGIKTAGDLLTHYPRGYIDFSSPIEINRAEVGEYAVIRAAVAKKLAPFFGKSAVYKLLLTDENGAIICTFFNSEYNFNRLVVNKEYIFYGKIGGNVLQKEIINPLFITPDDPNKLAPKYRLTAGLTNGIVSANARCALAAVKGGEPADLPERIRRDYSLIDVKSALEKIHFPASAEDYKTARRGLVFKELLVLQLGLAMVKARNRKLTGAAMPGRDIRAFYGNLPFKPTRAQLRAVDECVADMKKRVPMNRLLQGDVGSGKTAVAAALAYYAYLGGFQTALMVPTEILANQHYKTFQEFLTPLGVKTVLLTGGLSAAEKKLSRSEIKSGEAAVAVGTHALIQSGTEFGALGLVITDEQHRFGVGQRSKLISKGDNPHTLVISATPIPRTLGLIIYGDLDISVLDEMPKGRLPVKTYCVDTSFRERLYKFIIKRVGEGGQAYIVCPLIEESAANEKASAVNYYGELRETWLSGVPTALLHGRMKQPEKDGVMADFKSGKTKVLVSTTVIEVGVDVPDAVIMLIENAEQFGLSQLHQLRGRVGRGKEQSYCILVTDNCSPYTKARTDAMTRTTDGFEIADEDLKLRGPGDFFGQRQHGLPVLKIADMSEDAEILEETRKLAKSVIDGDPELTSPGNAGLKALVAELFKESSEYGYN
ncbi:MAG: ATP-dependent DNA helicase RecG [Oscillospiraceae bacterium]|jgi:ATP-dependent DNA helicase RecG|nr:ATP-dependent DNA helicase RecG [Oscillospiraceae bacterium]